MALRQRCPASTATTSVFLILRCSADFYVSLVYSAGISFAPARSAFCLAHQMRQLDRPRHSLALEKWGPPLGAGSPGRRVSDASVVFTPACGVIHPSCPLRGRRSTIRSNRKLAPPPRLQSRAVRLRRAKANSFRLPFVTRPRLPLMPGEHQPKIASQSL
jgi:hypothetical protein